MGVSVEVRWCQHLSGIAVLIKHHRYGRVLGWYRSGFMAVERAQKRVSGAAFRHVAPQAPRAPWPKERGRSGGDRDGNREGVALEAALCVCVCDPGGSPVGATRWDN